MQNCRANEKFWTRSEGNIQYFMQWLRVGNAIHKSAPNRAHTRISSSLPAHHYTGVRGPRFGVWHGCRFFPPAISLHGPN